MQTLSKGYKLPESGEFGDEFWPALEFDIVRLNDHTHDGIDSEQLPSAALAVSSVSVLLADFADQGDGYFRATASSPGGANLDNLVVKMRDPTTKEPIFGKIVKASPAAAYVYLNIPQDVEVLFGV